MATIKTPHVTKQLPLTISLDQRASFANTYVSKSNRSLIEHLQRLSLVANADSLFFWGKPGSGITHLLEAIQNQQQQLVIQYLPLNILKNFRPEKVTEGIETMDLVCIDDIQTIAGSPLWEQHLFHLFNRLKDADKPLIIGSHLPARQLPLQLPDLQSRCQWLTAYQLYPLSDQEKIQLLQYRSEKLETLFT